MRENPECTSLGPLLSVLNTMVSRNDLAYAEPPQRLSGGYSADLFAFRLANQPDMLGRLVIRLMRTDHAAIREMVIQCAVAELGFPAPCVRLSGDSSAGLGRPFIVMDHTPGKCPVSVSGPYSAWRAFQRLPFILADTMTALHSLDASVVRDRLAAAGYAAEHLGADAALAEIERLLPALSASGINGLNWLRQHRPAPPARAVVCHGDLHAFNLLAENGRITGVLDWELATVADGALDVARTVILLSFVPGPISAAVRPLVQMVGRRSARQFRGAYARVHRVDDVSLRWHEALQCLRLLTIVAKDRVDAALSPVAGLWEPLVPGLARRFAQITDVSVGLPASELPHEF